MMARTKTTQKEITSHRCTDATAASPIRQIDSDTRPLYQPHGGINKLKCPHCETMCKRSADLARHLHKQHGNFLTKQTGSPKSYAGLTIPTIPDLGDYTIPTLRQPSATRPSATISVCPSTPCQDERPDENYISDRPGDADKQPKSDEPLTVNRLTYKLVPRKRIKTPTHSPIPSQPLPTSPTTFTKTHLWSPRQAAASVRQPVENAAYPWSKIRQFYIL